MYSTREGSRDMAHPDISSLTTGKISSVMQNRNKIIPLRIQRISGWLAEVKS